MRIMIVGYSGSGKSTTARKLSNSLNLPLLHLDAINFLPNWVEVDTNTGVNKVKQFLNENESWVIDGNYTKFAMQERANLADYILFFNFPRHICLLNACKRFLHYKGRTREDMAQGCNEKLDYEFVKWILFEGRTDNQNKKYKQLIANYPTKTIVLRNTKQVKECLKKIIENN